MPKTTPDKVLAVDRKGRKVVIPAHWLGVKSLGFKEPPSRRKAAKRPTPTDTATTADAAPAESEED